MLSEIDSYNSWFAEINTESVFWRRFFAVLIGSPDFTLNLRAI